MEWVGSENVPEMKGFLSAKELFLPPAMKAQKQGRGTAGLFI
jgi:hypothetical protein